MNLQRERKILDKTSKGIKLYIKLDKRSSRKGINSVIKLFKSVAKLDYKNELLLPCKRGSLPKNLRYKHFALLILTGLYNQLGEKKYHKSYLKRVNLLEKKYLRIATAT